MKSVPFARLPLLPVALLITCSPVRLPAQPPPRSAQPPSAGSVNVPPEIEKAAKQYELAVKLHREKKTTEAIAAYRQFFRLADAAKIPAQKQLPAWQNLVGLYQVAGDARGMEEALKKIAAINPVSERV